MPELRSNTWSAIQSFPAPDGSRTLRVTLRDDVVDSLQTKVLRGVRESYLWSKSSGNARKLMTDTEVQTGSGNWIKLSEWQASRGSWEKPQNGHPEDFRLPLLVIDHLRAGRISSIQQKLVADPSCVSGVRADVIIETKLADGATQKESLEEYTKRESAVVELCVPLSSEESSAFFTGSTILGIRHTWSDETQHKIEVANELGVWVPLASNEVFVWNKVVTPHFRFISISPDRRKDHITSPTPWIQ